MITLSPSQKEVLLELRKERLEEEKEEKKKMLLLFKKLS